MAPSVPPVFLIQGPNLRQAALVNLPDVIDFGLHGPQITAAQFVGVHCLGPGVVAESSKPASRHHGVSHILKGLLGSRKSSAENLSGSSEDLRASTIPAEFLHQNFTDKLADHRKHSQGTGDPQNGDARSHIDLYQSLHGREEQNGREEISYSSSPKSTFYTGDVHTWELVWKEGKAGGPLKRLKFVTTDSGYKFIQNKLDAWVSASYSSMAMSEAAKAALDACGGHLKENPVYVQDSGIPQCVPHKRSDGEAVDNTALQATNLGDERYSAADTSAEDSYYHVDHIIDMHSIPLHGKIRPRYDSASSILMDDHVMAIAGVLPVRFRSYDWTLLYSTERDGISLNTLYRKVHMNGPTILVVRDFHKRIFGCYASEEWKVSGRSYGTGECFVFQLVPDLKAYKWTRTNSIFMFSNLDVLATGGGDHYSIMLNSDLLTGYSGACETFGSPPLASSEDFDISAVEVWGFQHFVKTLI
ncbi:unnamed protein product [Calypogeia fissa]